MAVSKDFYIDNQPGAPFRSELNTILAALVTANAGSDEPPNPSAGMMWLDTSVSPWKLKRRNEQNSGWVIHYDTSNKPTKADVGLNNVPNYSATASLTDGSTSKFALAKASKDLEDKKLDKTAVAADSAKLGGVAAASYALQTGTYSALRAQATTKGDVDLGNVANYNASSSVTLNSNTSYALSSAVFSLNQSKLDKTAVAADSAKLGGKAPSAYALSVHSHTAADLPSATTSTKGIVQLLDSVSSASTTLAAVPKSVKLAYDQSVLAYDLANFAKGVADKALPKLGGNLDGTLNYTPDTGDIIKLDDKVLLRRISSAGGVSFGADDVLIIGCGESRNTLQSNVSATAEETHIGSDGVIKLYTNLQSGWGSRKVFQFESDGGFLPANVTKTRQNLDVPKVGDSYLKSETYNQEQLNSKIPKTNYALLNFGTVTNNTRYVKDNPFGNYTPVICYAEIYANNKWAGLDFVVFASGNVSGTIAHYVEGEGIIIQTGKTYVMGSYSYETGSGHNWSGSVFRSALCRVHVWRLAV